MNGKVAVITRTKNRELFLPRAIESVISQDYQNFVHVVVNDGGDRASVDAVLNQYSEKYAGRLTVVHNDTSVGMEAASNVGLHASSSDYVVIHDDDDSWDPKFLSETVAALELCPVSTVKGVVSHTIQIFERVEGHKIEEVRRQEFDPWLSAVSLTEITEINKFMPISFLFKREVFSEIGEYDESLPVVGDWEFNIRFLSKFDIKVLKLPLAYYHIREGDAGSSFANTVIAARDDHLFYRSLVVNRYIRKEISSGGLTLGGLVAAGDYGHRLNQKVWRVVSIADRIVSSPIGRIAKRIFR